MFLLIHKYSINTTIKNVLLCNSDAVFVSVLCWFTFLLVLGKNSHVSLFFVFLMSSKMFRIFDSDSEHIIPKHC